MSNTRLGGVHIKPFLKGTLAFFSALVISAFLFSSLGYIEYSQADSATTDLQINVASVLSLRLEKSNTTITELALSVTPGVNTFAKDDLDVIVSTNNATGYTLSMADNDTDTTMHHTTTTITDAITSLSSSATDTTFPDNTWGYSLDSIANTQTFLPIPSSAASATIKATSTPATEDTTKVTFGVNISDTITAGTYQDTITFSAVTNYVPNALESISTMQEMTPQVCTAAAIGDTAILTDSRDNKTYTISKLADGKCWMTQNLHLVGPRTLTPADSNVASNFSLPASSDSFGTTDDAAGTDIARVNDTGNASYGAYYNWYTATAGSGTYAMSTQGENATQSICPKGWRLPKGGTIDANTGNGEFQKLYDAYGNYADFISATNAVLSGFWGNSSAGDQGSDGYWWSSTVYNAIIGYVLNFRTSNVNPQYNGLKRNGGSVRCIADDTITGLSTMQQMTSEICAATPTPATSATIVPEVTLVDVRGKDGTGTIENPATGANQQTYLVRKLADGNCWMTQNLNLTLSTSVTLDSATSDLTAGRTWTPQNNTQTAVGTTWAQDGSDGARSFEPGEAMYFDGGMGTGTLDTSTYNYSGYLSSGAAYWHVGNYYNWYAATAGTGLSTTATDGTPTTVSDSICPKGWKLPDNSGSKSFLNLVATTYGITDDATGATKLLQAPLNFVRSGLYAWDEARVRGRGYYGYWWSNTAYTALDAHRLITNPSRVIPQNGISKGGGLSVRCVAR